MEATVSYLLMLQKYRRKIKAKLLADHRVWIKSESRT